jgi:hypothetical protein
MSRRPGKSYARLEQLAREWVMKTGDFAPKIHLRATVPCRCMGLRIQNRIEERFPTAEIVVDTALFSDSSDFDLPYAEIGYGSPPIDILFADGVLAENVLSLFEACDLVEWLADHLVRVDDDDGGDDARYRDRRGYITGVDSDFWDVTFEDNDEQGCFAAFQLSLISCPSR